MLGATIFWLVTVTVVGLSFTVVTAGAGADGVCVTNCVFGGGVSTTVVALALVTVTIIVVGLAPCVTTTVESSVRMSVWVWVRRSVAVEMMVVGSGVGEAAVEEPPSTATTE